MDLEKNLFNNLKEALPIGYIIEVASIVLPKEVIRIERSIIKKQ
jgi:hypothetical protein